MSPVLTSSQNPLIKEIRKAVRRGGLTDSGFSVAEGMHLVVEAERSGREIATVLWEDGRGPCGRQCTLVSPEVFAEISSTENSQGVIALVKPRSSTLAEMFETNPALIVLIDGVQDPGNAGTIVRSAEAFGAGGIVFLKGSVNPYNPKALRASAGSAFRLPIVSASEDEALEALERAGVAICAGDPRAATTISKYDWTRPTALAIGAEGSGIRASISARSQPLRIPTALVESLNAAAAASVTLYEAARQRGGMR